MIKKILILLIAIMSLQVVSANLIDERVGGAGSIVNGAISNTYDVDGYILELTGSEHIFRSQPMQIYEEMYLSIWFEDVKKDQTIEVYNYNTSSWDFLGLVKSGLKVGFNYNINMTNYHDNKTHTSDIRITSQNGDVLVDKIIFSSNSIAETIKRVEQVDWVETVNKVNEVDHVNEASMEVHGTEYLPGERAKVWLQLLNETGGYVNDAVCQIDIYTPTNEEYLEMATMTNIQHDGVYVYDLIAPQEQGVYPAIARCYYDIAETDYISDGFDLTTGFIDGGDYTDTWFLDGDEHKINEELLGGDYRLDFWYNFSDVCAGISEDFLTSVTISVNSKWKDSVLNDDVTLSLYNFTSATWFELPNNIITPNDRVTVTNTIETNNLSKDGFISTIGETRLRYQDADIFDNNQNKIENDWVQFSCNEFTNPEWTEVKGSSEMHISSERDWVIAESSISGNLTNESRLDIFKNHLTVSSLSSFDEENVRVYFNTPEPFSCHHVTNLSIDGVPYEFDLGNSANDMPFSGCKVSWEQNLSAKTNYEVVIKSDNFFKITRDTFANEAYLTYGFVNLACQNYRIQNGFSEYTIPAEGNTFMSTGDVYYDFCLQYYDLFFRFNDTLLNEFSFNEGEFDYYQMTYLENVWLHLIKTHQQLDSMGQTISDGMNLGNSYSLAIISNPSGITIPNYATYWANASSSYNAFLRTYAIPSETWSYSSTISSNILNQFSSTLWSYTARYIHGEELS